VLIEKNHFSVIVYFYLFKILATTVKMHATLAQFLSILAKFCYNFFARFFNCFCTIFWWDYTGQRGGVAFTPVAPPSRQRSHVVIRQNSSDSVIGNGSIRVVS